MVKTFEWRDDALLPVADSSDLEAASAALPTGAYTGLRTYRGRRFLHLGDHAARLVASSGAPFDVGVLRAALRAALDATRYPESRLRVTFAPPRLFVALELFVPPAESPYRDGVRCATLPLRRERPHAKDTRFIATAAFAYRGLPPDVHEGLLVADDGAVLEGLSSNFFALADGRLRTEDERALPGITRALVLDVARDLVPVVLAAVHVDELSQVSECFITSASRGVMPVVRVDEATVANGRPGPITAELRRRFEERIAAEAEEV